MVLAPAALYPASEDGIGCLDVVGTKTRSLADLVGPNHIATTHDHVTVYMLLRMICN